MLSDSDIRRQIPNLLAGTRFDFLGARYEGKVRDNYTLGGTRFLIATDRLSCFDRVVSTIPFKGQVLTDLAAFWFERSRDIIANHLIDIPDPNTMVVKQCEVLPVEVIVRGYLAGSAWRDYQAGKAISGVTLPPGLRMSSKLPQIIVTPSTKAEKNSHDLPISEKEIVERGLLSRSLWEQVRETALALFALGTREVAKRGLLMVDTKYEFGMLNGKLVLVDEIHTLDSSRFWMESSYAERYEAGTSPEMLDREPVRQWLLAQNFKGDGPIPLFSDDYRTEVARHYLGAYEMVVGAPLKTEVGDVLSRVERNLRGYLSQKKASAG